MKIAVVGTGLIGQAWAIVFSRGKHEVRLWDGFADAVAKALPLIEAQLNDLDQAGLLDEAPAVLLARITPCATLQEAVDGADYVQESLPERVDVKKLIFAQLDKIAAPTAVLASSTSSIPASAFTEDIPGRARCVIAHPVNPPCLVPVVEICGAPWTDAKTVQKTWDVMQSTGQKPVKINKELEGFVLNRLQGALLREAFRLVEQGYVDAEGLDVTVREGLGLRWAFMGPFETIDLNAPGGIADYAKRYGPMYESISTEQTSTEPWSDELVARLEAERRQYLAQDKLLERRMWRDRRLMGLAAHKKAASKSIGD
jgi:3-hydroxyacyl-CoA dehydrogenase